MSVALTREAWAYLEQHPELSATERLLLLFLADAGQERRHKEGGRWVPERQSFHSSESIARRLGVTERGLKDTRYRLSQRGLEVRVPIGADKHGNPIFGKPGAAMTYVLPPLQGDATTAPRGRDDGPSATAGDATTAPRGRESVGEGDVDASPQPEVNPNENSKSSSTSNSNQVPASLTSAHEAEEPDPWEQQEPHPAGPALGLMNEEEDPEKSSGPAADVPPDVTQLLTAKGYPDWVHADTWADAMAEEWHDTDKALALIDCLPTQDPSLPPF